MNVSCSDCGSVFRVDPGRVPAGGVRARCAVCGGIIVVSHQASDTLVQTAVRAPAARAVQVRGPDARGGAGGGPIDETPPEVPHQGQDVDEPIPGPSDVRAVPPPAASDAALSEPDVPSALAAPSAPAPLSPQRTLLGADPSPAPRIGPRRVNPYLNNDPAQRARRLARALVSDLVAYHPEKREEGLRAGTLKELFRDDIRKSWQEYVEQVGAPVAEQTPHFQDALNDILAAGRRVF